MMKLMFITADAEVAKVAMASGVDRIFVDLEVIGKQDRQGGMNTVQSQHTFKDIADIRAVMMPDRELLVRTNPIHDKLQEEVDSVVACGADIVMLPYFHTADDVEKFVAMVGGRAKVCLLIENKEAAIDNLDAILEVDGVDEYYVGLNDLNLSLGGKFMFEPMANGILDAICAKLKATGKPYGFGGVARVGEGMIPGEAVITEHYRLESTIVIVSRSFCNTSIITDIKEVEAIFNKGIAEIRDYEKSLNAPHNGDIFAKNHDRIVTAIEKITNG